MPGDYRLVIKGHDGAQIGVLDAYESLTYQKKLNDVGEAVLVANYGVTDATDALLDELTDDIILEVQRHPDPTDSDLDWYVDWIGFCKDPKTSITQAATKKRAWTFVHCNHLLKRRLIIPPKDKMFVNEYREYSAPRWLDTQLVSNVMRQLVRYQCQYPEDLSRRFPCFYVQDNEAEPASTGQPGIVFSIPDSEYFMGVLSTYVWGDYLYIGLFHQTNYRLRHSTDGESWSVTVAEAMDYIWDIHTWDDGGGERMFLATGQSANRSARVRRSDVANPPTTFGTVLNRRFYESAFLVLEDHGNYLYAGSGAGFYNSGGAPNCRRGMGHVYRTNDGVTWNRVVDGDGDTGSKYGKYHEISGLKSFDGYIYAGGCYKDSEPPLGTGLHTAHILRSQTGASGTWSVVLEIEGIEKPNADGDLETQPIDGFCCLEEFGGYLYAGIGSRYNPRFGDGRIYRSSDGTTWEQVFGGNMENNTHYAAPGVTHLAPHGDYLWAACGGDGRGDIAVWWTADGTTWYKSFDGLGYPAPMIHSMDSYKGNFFVAMGLVPDVTDQWAFQFGPACGGNTYMYEYEPGLGALWRMTDEGGWEPPDWSRQGSGRFPFLLDVLKQLANDSLDTEGGIDFGIIPTDLGGDVQDFLFMVKSPWGTDHRSTSDDPVLIGVPRGNMTDPEYGNLTKDRPNATYALGAGQQEEREVLEFVNPNLIMSPWGRVEGVADVQRADTPTELYQWGRAVVQGQGPQETLTFRILETPATRYGAEWQMGDLLTAIFDDIVAHVKIEAVTVRLGSNPATEEIDTTIRLLETV